MRKDLLQACHDENKPLPAALVVIIIEDEFVYASEISQSLTETV